MGGRLGQQAGTARRGSTLGRSAVLKRAQGWSLPALRAAGALGKILRKLREPRSGRSLGPAFGKSFWQRAFGRLISRGTVEGPGGNMASLQCGRAGSGSARPALPLGWLVAASGQASARVACLSRLEKRPCRHAAGRALSGMRSAQMQTAGFGASRSRPGRWPESPVCDKLKRPLHSHGAAMYSSGKSVNFVRCV